MTNPTDPTFEDPGARRTVATSVRGRWPGVVWALPVAALLIVGYFGFQTLSHNGVDVVVAFDAAAEAKPGDTRVVYRGLSVGHVTRLRLSDARNHVEMTLKLDPSTKPLLRTGTKFWLIGAAPNLTDINSLRAAVAGVSIGMAPGEGRPTRRFVGLEQPPPILPGTPGSAYLLVSSQVGAARVGSSVFYHGQDVGKVTGIDLLGRNNFKTHIFVTAPFDRFVREGALFYNSSPVSISLAGGSLSTQLAPGNAAIGGGIEFDTPPDVVDQTSAPPGASFPLFPDRAHAIVGPRGPQLFYRVLFEGPVGQLDVGAPVTLRGFQVGSVTARTLELDLATGTLATPVTIGIEPERLRPQEGRVTELTPRIVADTDRAMALLVRAGYRARLTQTPPLVGGQVVELAKTSGAPGAVLGERGADAEFPLLPSRSSGDLNDLTMKADDLLDKVNQVPIADIGRDVRKITANFSALISSPEVKDSLKHLDGSLSRLDAILAEAKPKVGPLIDNLNRTADQLQTLSASTNALVSGEGAAQDSSLPAALRQMTDAARSLRALANYLGRHPEAVIRGKAKDK